jgi:hypothetical protein
LFQLAEKGLLPNIKKLIDNGIYSKNCITDFPSITYPTQASMITGTYTGDYRNELCHGIPLMNWMDREYLHPKLRTYAARDMDIYKLNEDIGDNCKTILEMLGDGNTVSITQFLSKGANYFYPERKTKLIMLYLLLYLARNTKKTISRANSVVVQKLLRTFINPKKFFHDKGPPIGSLLWFITSDILLHLHGFDSHIYKLNLLHIDKVIGFLLDSLEKLGYLDDTAIAITSDHGNYKATRVGNLQNFLHQNSLKHYHPRKNRNGNVNIAKFDGIGFFNFKGTKLSTSNHSWPHPNLKELENYGPRGINLFKELFKIKGSKTMFFRDDKNSSQVGIIHLKKRNARTNKITEGRIEYRGSGNDYKTRYISDNPEDDVFDYLNDSIASQLIDGKYHSTQEWLTATYHLDYPLIPDLIPRHFKNPRSSDIILSGDGSVVYNFEFGKQANNYLYNHDLGLKKCMVVPLIIGGSSEIPHKHIPYCKITDIVPTLLGFLGITPHKSVVGKNLL